jgi:hypothetical protein
MNSFKQDFNCQAIGRVVIHDQATGEMVLDKKNAIHPQNMALVIARALARDDNGYIFNLCFGNGGTFLNSSGQINYRAPNVIGAADLYNVTYVVQVDDQSIGTPPANSVVSLPSPTPATTAMIVVTAQLSASEPAGQAPADNITTNTESLFTFDEIGLKTQDGLLLSHLVFSPIEKTANRSFLITYTLTVSVS